MAFLDNSGLSRLWNNIVNKLSEFAKSEDVNSSINLLNEQINQNKTNISILSNKISNSSTNSLEEYTEISSPNISLGKVSGTTKLLIDSTNDALKLKTANSSATFDKNGFTANQFNTTISKIGTYTLVYNTQNNHMTIKWVGDN